MNEPNKSIPQLDNSSASKLMDNIFLEMGKAPSAVPFEVLTSHVEYKNKKQTLLVVLLIIAIVALLLVPVAFISPKFTVSESERENSGIITYEIKVENIMPLKSIKATLDGESISTAETEAGSFLVKPLSDGELEIRVTLANNQYETWTKTISGIDTAAPMFIKSQMLNKKTIRVFVMDSKSGIDYENSYGIKADGTRFEPSGYGDGYLDFACSNDMNLFILDKLGNILQLAVAV